ncbi:unnamed protein product [Rotaria sordida]|uniref:Glutamate--tRNA ligase n=1 Tax=Rotaria sordida TaxID=392033 RepID=A0A813PQP1_9BILA|nr:unnamed protein product [Rotaria sordida]
MFHLESVMASIASTNSSVPQKSNMKDEGKFVELPNAKEGEVIVRFPPEASGYLHIGHAKAALLNQYYQKTFKGTLIMRFDDTNPAKETAEFEQVILEDLKMLGVEYDRFTHTSDHFDTLINYCKILIEKGLAYCDDTEPEEMKQQREQRQESVNRNNSVEKNLKLWSDMLAGNEQGQKCCVRLKINMNSNNGCMRDPTIHRCKPEEHVRTGNKYKVYPTYDFACPIVDSIEGVTHALRTTEYHDRDEQYYWILDALGLRKPFIYEYARLNMQYTVLSKRKLTWFVNTKIVDGWDDPRLPTVRGILRRGMTVEGLRQFIVAQGSSRSVVLMDWDKIWAFNKKQIDPVAPRFTALLKNQLVKIKLTNITKEECQQHQKHPKDSNIGMKNVYYGSTIFIEKDDAVLITEGQIVTLMNWGNIKINRIQKKDSGDFEFMEGETQLDNKDFKNTLKLTWLAETSQAPLTPVKCIHYDNIMTKAKLDEGDTFENYVNYASKIEYDIIGEPEMAQLKKGDVIQILRKGYYICDAPYDAATQQSCCLLNIPDGGTKEKPTSLRATDNAATKSTGDKLTSSAVSGPEVDQLTERIVLQGEKVRDLKANKSTSKDDVNVAVKELVLLKEEYKKLTGSEYKPSNTTAQKENKKPITNSTSNEAEKLTEQITRQGDKVRDLKANKSTPKEEITAAVGQLLKLKEEYKTLTGTDVPSSGAASARKEKEKKPAAAAAATAKKPEHEQNSTSAHTDLKKQTKLGIEYKKEEDLADWYGQVVRKGELIENYDVSGCYILRPWAYFLWEQIKAYIDAEISEMGVQNCYFPLFVSHNALYREQTHIADFSPEVAWVTKSGDSDLAQPIAVRPTSETIMYPAYAKWIQSHRDLPLKLNQWNNVVRWEFKNPQPFLRTREFLWQEGHTAWATEKEASDEVYQILDLYAKVYTDLLAIPVIKGRKTEKEKFAGADWTTTIEGYIAASGRGIQAATSHHLGQNFSKMFDITFEDPQTQTKQYVYQNSWGLTTRTIGVMTMIHGDNQGLVLPPRIAKYQLVIVPCGITASLSKEDEDALINTCKEVETKLKKAGLRVYGDYRDNYSPGWKFNHWEMKGVPIRIEIGPKDKARSQLTIVLRHTGARSTIPIDNSETKLHETLNQMHNDLYKKAKDEFDSHTILVKDWASLLKGLDNSCLMLAPFCGEPVCEDRIKKDSARDAVVEEGAPAMGAKGLCIPFEQPEKIAENQLCCHPDCKTQAKYYTLFGRSY